MSSVICLNDVYCRMIVGTAGLASVIRLDEMRTSNNPKPTYNPLGSGRFTTVLAILFITVVGVYVLGTIGSKVSSYVGGRKQRERANWPQRRKAMGSEGRQGAPDASLYHGTLRG